MSDRGRGRVKGSFGADLEKTWEKSERNTKNLGEDSPKIKGLLQIWSEQETRRSKL